MIADTRELLDTGLSLTEFYDALLIRSGYRCKKAGS